MEKFLARFAQALLRYRARLYWKELENHISKCHRHACMWQYKNGIPEDQSAMLFCYYGGKIWENHWDMIEHSENIPTWKLKNARQRSIAI